MDIPYESVGGLKLDPSVKEKLMRLPRPAWLRVGVEGGGCSGFQYEIALGTPNADDFSKTFETDVGVVVDPVSAPFLKDAVLMFSKDLVGARFTIDNPNATSSCGCGVSFSV